MDVDPPRLGRRILRPKIAAKPPRAWERLQIFAHALIIPNRDDRAPFLSVEAKPHPSGEIVREHDHPRAVTEADDSFGFDFFKNPCRWLRLRNERGTARAGHYVGLLLSRKLARVYVVFANDFPFAYVVMEDRRGDDAPVRARADALNVPI